MLIGMMSLLFVRAVKKVDYTDDVKMLPEAMMEIEEKQDVEKEKRKEKTNGDRLRNQPPELKVYTAQARKTKKRTGN